MYPPTHGKYRNIPHRSDLKMWDLVRFQIVRSDGVRCVLGQMVLRWVMITGGRSWLQGLGHDTGCWVRWGMGGSDFKLWDLMKHRHVGGKHEGRVMITGGGSWLQGVGSWWLVDGSDYGLTARGYWLVITGCWVFMSGVGFDGDYALGVKQPLTDLVKLL